LTKEKMLGLQIMKLFFYSVQIIQEPVKSLLS